MMRETGAAGKSRVNTAACDGELSGIVLPDSQSARDFRYFVRYMRATRYNLFKISES